MASSSSSLMVSLAFLIAFGPLALTGVLAHHKERNG